jgi:phosphoglycolate phosphatase-like HAD superfamily hydrolase
MGATEEIVIFDIDGTLADVSERIHHLKKKPKDWPAFFRGMAQDKAIRSMVRLCNILYSSGIKVILCSGRSEEHRKETVQWLTRQNVNYHELWLRRNGDRRSDVTVKRKMLARIDKGRVLFVVEDRSRVVEMWRSEGLVCLQCAPGEF